MKNLILLFSLILSVSAYSEFQGLNNVFFNNVILTVETTDIAMKGYDPISYFTDGDGITAKAQQGSDQFTSTYLGATYKFSSQENKELFDSNPEKYAP